MPLSTFRGACFLNISVMEAYIVKCDILVIALFTMILRNSESHEISFRIYYF